MTIAINVSIPEPGAYSLVKEATPGEVQTALLLRKALNLPDPQTLTFPWLLKYQRLARDLSQKDFAPVAGITPAQLSMYENGERFPSDDVLRRMIRNLGDGFEDGLKLLGRAPPVEESAG